MPWVASASFWLIKSSPEMSAMENSTPAFLERACNDLSQTYIHEDAVEPLSSDDGCLVYPNLQHCHTCRRIYPTPIGYNPDALPAVKRFWLLIMFWPFLPFDLQKNWLLLPFDLPEMWSNGLNKIRGESKLKKCKDHLIKSQNNKKIPVGFCF